MSLETTALQALLRARDLRVASQQGEIQRLKTELAIAVDTSDADRQVLAAVGFRFWQAEFAGIAVRGDARAEFDAEFRSVAKRLGVVPMEPADVDPDGT